MGLGTGRYGHGVAPARGRTRRPGEDAEEEAVEEEAAGELDASLAPRTGRTRGERVDRGDERAVDIVERPAEAVLGPGALDGRPEDLGARGADLGLGLLGGAAG